MENPNILRRGGAIFWVLGLVFRRHFFLAPSTLLATLILSLEPVVSLSVFSKVVDLSLGYVEGTVSLGKVGTIFALQGGSLRFSELSRPSGIGFKASSQIISRMISRSS